MIEEKTEATVAAPAQEPKKTPLNPINPLAKQENIVGWLFCTPIIIGILVFSLVPVILSLISMFYAWEGTAFITESPFVGWGNFHNVFADAYSKKFGNAIINMLLYAIQLPIGLALGMVLGLAMNRSMKGVQTFRILYYLPSVMSIVAVTIVFQKLFNDTGYVNQLLGTHVDWLGKRGGLAFTVNFLLIWKGCGYTALMYIAGLQSVSTDQLEAARIDGANGWIIFLKITIPALYPITFYLLVTGLMGALQVFNEPFVLAGTADHAITVVSFVYYFRGSNLGVSAVAAWFLAILIFIVTMIQMYFDSKKDKEA